MGPLCSAVLWLAPSAARRSGPSPGKPVGWRAGACWVVVLCVWVLLRFQIQCPPPPSCSRPPHTHVPLAGRPRPEWQHLALLVFAPASRSGRKCPFFFLFLFIFFFPPKNHEKCPPFPPPSSHVPSVSSCSLLITPPRPPDVSFLLFTQFAPFFPPRIYPPPLLTRLAAEENEQRTRKQRDRAVCGGGARGGAGQALALCCHVMLMVSRSGSILQPGDGPSHPSP